MAVRAHYENSNEIGVYGKLTNTYCMVGVGGSQNFYRLVHFLTCFKGSYVNIMLMSGAKYAFI